MGLPDGEEIMTLAFFVMTQYRRVMDGRTVRTDCDVKNEGSYVIGEFVDGRGVQFWSCRRESNGRSERRTDRHVGLERPELA